MTGQRAVAKRDGAKKLVPSKWLLPDLPFPKPPYRIPSMVEIAAVPPTGLNLVSTFSGCGGGCLGFRMAGYRVLWASEFVSAARDTYRANNPATILDERDIRNVQPVDVFAATGLKVGEIDVLEGSPPCASFSMAGTREAHWGQIRQYSDTKQRVDDLFDEYVRLIAGLQPKVFVAENVPGLLIGAARTYFDAIIATLRVVGYRVDWRVLDAQWFGVPQCRRRVIIIGVRDDIGRDPAFPSPNPYRYSVREAIPQLADALQYGVGGWDKPGVITRAVQARSDTHHGAGDVTDRPMPTVLQDPRASAFLKIKTTRVIHDTSGAWGAGDVTDRPLPAVTVGVNSVNARHFQVVTEGDEEAAAFTERERLAAVEGEEAGLISERDVSLAGLAIGAEAEGLEPGEGSAKYFNLVRSRIDGPVQTVTQTAGKRSAAGVIHPTEIRKFTIDELKRLCGFPDDFILTGTYQQQWERLGRAVMPLVYKAVAETIAGKLLR